MTQPLQPNLKGLPYAPAECVLEAEQIQSVITAIKSVADTFDSAGIVSQFCDTYHSWILSTKNNTVQGLDRFSQRDYSLGTSEAFDKFYIRHHNRRFRCFRGEYLYHTLAWHQQRMTWAWLDDEDVKPNDAVIVSLPFADLGNVHPAYTNALLNRCLQLDVPVLVDCAFFGICANIDFDFSHAAITDVCFSLSKTFPVNNMRIGMRYSTVNDTMTIYNSTGYVNRLGAAVGLDLVSLRSPDFAYQKWHDQQVKFCDQMNVLPSNTVIFGIDNDHRYDQYNRGMLHTNRLCFSRYFEQGQLDQ